MDEVDKRVDLFKTYIELAILDYPIVNGKDLQSSLLFFEDQLVKFTKDLTYAADKIESDFIGQNSRDVEILKSKLEVVINESKIRFSKRI